MAQTSFPFDDQEVTETQFSEMFRNLQDSGVVGSSALEVSADSSGLNVKVRAGQAFVRGHFYESTAVETLTIETGDAAARIDTCVLRLDPTRNVIELAISRGVASVNPVAPTLVQTTAGIYELGLADIAVPANAVTIAGAAVTSRRPFTSGRVGRWPTAGRPKSPDLGRMGFNDTFRAWEFWNGTGWGGIPSWSAPAGLEGRTVHINDSAPTSSQGANGDVWLEY